MVQDTGRLENSFKKPDKYSTIIKTHKYSMKMTTLKHKRIVYNATGTFRTNISLTNGTDVTVNNIESLPVISTLYFNDDKVFYRPLTSGSDLSEL